MHASMPRCPSSMGTWSWSHARRSWGHVSIGVEAHDIFLTDWGCNFKLKAFHEKKANPIFVWSGVQAVTNFGGKFTQLKLFWTVYAHFNFDIKFVQNRRGFRAWCALQRDASVRPSFSCAHGTARFLRRRWRAWWHHRRVSAALDRPTERQRRKKNDSYGKMPSRSLYWAFEA